MMSFENSLIGQLLALEEMAEYDYKHLFRIHLISELAVWLQKNKRHLLSHMFTLF